MFDKCSANSSGIVVPGSAINSDLSASTSVRDPRLENGKYGPDTKKRLSYGYKTHDLIWNNWYFRDFIAHKLAKYQYFSIRPSLFV